MEKDNTTQTHWNNWHYVKQECACAISQILVHDLQNEDVNAYETARESKGLCDMCNKNYKVSVIKI